MRSKLAFPGVLCALGAALALAACDVPTQEEKARAAEAKAKESLVAIDHLALSQKLDPKLVERIQQNLTKLNEYMGPINGKLDQITVNAYEAFQRANDMTPDGMITDDGLRLLDAAAQARGATAAR